MPNTTPNETTDEGDDLAQRVADLEKQLAASQRVAALVPLTTIPRNGAGPGMDNSQLSWGLSAQEAAGRGEWHEAWGDQPEDWGEPA